MRRTTPSANNRIRRVLFEDSAPRPVLGLRLKDILDRCRCAGSTLTAFRDNEGSSNGPFPIHISGGFFPEPEEAKTRRHRLYKFIEDEEPDKRKNIRFSEITQPLHPAIVFHENFQDGERLVNPSEASNKDIWKSEGKRSSPNLREILLRARIYMEQNHENFRKYLDDGYGVTKPKEPKDPKAPEKEYCEDDFEPDVFFNHELFREKYKPVRRHNKNWHARVYRLCQTEKGSLWIKDRDNDSLRSPEAFTQVRGRGTDPRLKDRIGYVVYYGSGDFDDNWPRTIDAPPRGEPVEIKQQPLYIPDVSRLAKEFYILRIQISPETPLSRHGPVFRRPEIYDIIPERIRERIIDAIFSTEMNQGEIANLFRKQLVFCAIFYRFKDRSYVQATFAKLREAIEYLRDTGYFKTRKRQEQIAEYKLNKQRRYGNARLARLWGINRVQITKAVRKLRNKLKKTIPLIPKKVTRPRHRVTRKTRLSFNKSLYSKGRREWDEGY